MQNLLKTTIQVSFFLLGSLFLSNLSAQSSAVSNSDFENLTHQWKGNLQYLNYGDDKSKFTIPCIMDTKFKNGKLQFNITFDEMKNGKKMTSKSNFKISKDGDYVIMDGEKWKIKSSEKTEGKIQVIALKRGKDNDRLSDLKMTFNFENGTSISWKKDVKYDGTASFFNRNQFSFSY